MTDTERTKRRDSASLTSRIIGAAIEVHRTLGPGLLESVYESCLVYELGEVGLRVESQKITPVRYKHATFECGYRLDIVVEGQVVVEVKAVAQLTPMHEAQLLTYLRMYNGRGTGLLINFNVKLLKEGIRRLIV